MISRSPQNQGKIDIGTFMTDKFGIHWFRRDLRVAGNPGLQINFKKNEGRVLGLFCFDPVFLARSDFSPNRFAFFLKTLSELKKEMKSLGGDLIVLDRGPDSTWKEIVKEHSNSLSLVTWNRDYEPFALERDQRISTFLRDQNISFATARDHLLIEPNELFQPTDSTKGYQVFSPFARRWLDLFKSEEIQSRLKQQMKGLSYLQQSNPKKIFNLSWNDLDPHQKFSDCLPKYESSNLKNVTVQIPDAGSTAAYRAMLNFEPHLKNYGKNRDFPSIAGTSKFSIFLKNGSLTTGQIISQFNLQAYFPKAESGSDKFLSELIWREFYYHILFRNPRVENEAFIQKFKDIQWENSSEHFEAWKNGMTGFPIVDAGMRELKETGWMHNRVRMIVASFLTKDLLIDWKWGEKYFMNALLDGDLAPNNGGWQWAASTGCDPQPYFRIFNPWLQGEKFDKSGEYIKKYVPELRNVDPKLFHKPPSSQLGSYPLPIVDHSVQRVKALKLYSA